MNRLSKLFSASGKSSYTGNDPFYTDLELINAAHHKITYRGLPMLKCPFDMVNYQMLISKIEPDLIIEIGTLKGGSALWFSDLLRSIGNGSIHSIDLKQEGLDAKVREAENIRFFEGGWQNYDLEEASGYGKIMVIDDGSHTYEDVKGAFQKFSPLVPKGSYYIIEDGILDQLNISKKKFNGGPVRAIEEILAQDESFEPDQHLLNFFGTNATFNPLGYLRKK